jgi:uncharacterized protein (TIGR03000 family)
MANAFFPGGLIMVKRIFWVSCVLASLALIVLLDASVVQAGGNPPSYFRELNRKPTAIVVVREFAPAVVVREFAPAFKAEGVFSAYYAPAVGSTAGGQELSEPFAAARIEMTVPATAEVWLDGHKTHQTGSERLFVTPPLERGKPATYAMRVRWTTAAGEVVDVTRPIEVSAGRHTVLGFGR